MHGAHPCITCKKLYASWRVSCRIAGRHLVLSGGNTTHIKISDDCAVYVCTVVSSQHQASLLWRGLGFLATFALQSWLMCSILRIMPLQLGASVVTVDDRFLVRSICSIFVVYRSAFIPAYPYSISTQLNQEDAHTWASSCKNSSWRVWYLPSACCLALVRLLRSQLSYAGLLYIKLTTSPVSTECIHEATLCQSLKDNRKHNHTEIIWNWDFWGVADSTV